MAQLCINDAGAGDANASANVVTFVGAYGAFEINVSSYFGEPAFQGGFGFDIGSVNTSSGAGTLILSGSQNDLTFGAGGPVAVSADFSQWV